MCDGGDEVIDADELDFWRSAGSDEVDDLNWLQTRLHVALDAESYQEAAKLRDRIRRITGASAGAEAAWSNLGIPDWLSDRLERLSYPLPTRVQMHALRAMESGEDAAVCAPTGSGKTLSYLLPLLAQLSDDLLSEDLSGFLAGFLDGGRSAVRRTKGQQRRKAVTDSAVEAEGGGGLNDLSVPTPAVLIVVPTRELGVQVSMLCYRLLGGGTTNPSIQPYNHPSRFVPGGKANMFSYKGPRHVQVAGLWDEQSLYAADAQDALKGVHVIVGTPEHISRCSVGGNLRLQNVRGMVVDEADACLNNPESAKEMGELLQRMQAARASANNVPPPQTILVGASLAPGMVQRAAAAGWVRAPTLVSEFGWIDRGCDLEAIARRQDGSSSSMVGADPSDIVDGLAGWTEQRVPAGSAHEYIVCEPKESVAVMCRLLRERFETAQAQGVEAPRVVIFANSAADAVRLASQLQGALFGTISGDASEGLWGLSVLLPSSEGLETTFGEDDATLSVLESSLRVMEMFACNKTSVLVTTAAATRGLDFPQVTDVLNLGIVGSPADYVHRAGRVGRVGQLARGSVVSVLCAAEEADLLNLGRELQFKPKERVAPAPAEPLNEDMSQEEQVQALSDIYNLLDADADADK